MLSSSSATHIVTPSDQMPLMSAFPAAASVSKSSATRRSPGDGVVNVAAAISSPLPQPVAL